MGTQSRQGPPPPPPLLLPAFPGTTLLLTSPDAPGGKLIVKLKPEGTQETTRTQTIILAGMPAGWAPPRQDGAPIRFQLATGIRTIMLSKAGEQLGPKEIHTVSPAQVPPPSDSSTSCTSKGVYENYRRWQRYKALARQHFPGTPDAEALACFFIPVLRSLSRLRPELAPEEGVLRAVQEWERSSNFERMIFYEMAEKFMEFEAEEELQIQKMKLLNSSQFQPPSVESPKPVASDSSQQQVYIPKKVASKGRQPRRRQRRLPGPPATGEPREIPPEAVRQYTEIMEGLQFSWEEEDGEAGRCGEPQSQVLPDPGLLEYLEQLCEDESFVCKVEAVIHPQFLAQLLSLEKQCDLLDLNKELEQEMGLTPSQLVEKRLLAFSEEELSPSACPAPQSDSTPSQSEEEEDEGGSIKGLTGLCQSVSTALPPRGCGTLEAELPERLLTSGAEQMSQSSQWQPGTMSFEDMAAPTGPPPWKSGSQGGTLASLRSRVERASQQSQVKGQNGGQREDSEITRVPLQPGGQVWGLMSQGETSVGLGNLESTHSGYRRQDGHREGKVKGRSEASTGVEQLGDASMRAECNCHSDKLVESGNLESTLNEQKNQDGCQKETITGQPQAGWEALEDVPRATSQAKIVRSCRDRPVKQISLESTLTGYGKQDGSQEGQVRGQNQKDAALSAPALREHDLQCGSTGLSGKNVREEKSPSSDPTRIGEQDGSQAGLPIKLECRVGSTQTMATLLGRVNGWALGLAHQSLGANRKEENEWPRGSNIHGQHPDPKKPTETQAASGANSCCQEEPGGRFVMSTGSIQPCLQDGSNHKGHDIRSTAKLGNLEEKEARATSVCGKGTGSQDDGKEVGESSSAMGDGPSKRSTITHPTGNMADVGKHSNDEDDEELSIFSILLASKLRLSSPEGPFGAVPTLRDQPGPHSQTSSLTWEPIGWENMRKSSTCPGEGPSGALSTDHGIQHSHKRRGDKMATRRSKRLRSQ